MDSTVDPLTDCNEWKRQAIGDLHALIFRLSTGQLETLDEFEDDAIGVIGKITSQRFATDGQQSVPVQ